MRGFSPVAEHCGSRPKSFPGIGPEPAFQRCFGNTFSTDSGKLRWFGSMAGSHPGEILCRVPACLLEPFCCFAPRQRASADQPGGEPCSLPTGLPWSARISSPRSPLLFLSRSGRGGPSFPACPLFSLLTICPTRSVLFWPCCIVPRPETAQIPFGKSLQPYQDNF